ncbi:hypothetical protein Q7P35_011930 [Cladosporium inversicolor]
MLEESAAGRMGNPVECGQLAAFLMDERGAFITGTDILNDGGVVAAIKAGVIDLKDTEDMVGEDWFQMVREEIDEELVRADVAGLAAV